MEKNRIKSYRLVLAALFLALGMILPFFTAQIPEIGSMLLPMHIPVLVCGFVCGWKYGLIVGLLTPLLRSMTFSMPPLFPSATAMAFEMAAYGAICGLTYERLPRGTKSVYASLLTAMVGGRIVWGIVQIPILGIAGKGFGWQAFVAGAFLNAVPGIILQIVMIPLIVIALERANVMEIQGK